MREIILDTETTGIDPAGGHRIIEIGCVEVFNRIPTGREYHTYLNPERDVPDEAFRIHGLSRAFLSDKPLFSHIVGDFLSFISNSPLVIHNAAFDIKFINHELSIARRDLISIDRAVDTLFIARRKFPGGQASLDALCRRFNVDLSAREKHGALLDAQLLAEVYAELMGGRQAAMELVNAAQQNDVSSNTVIKSRPATKPTEEESKAHEEFLKKIKNPLWETAS